MNKETFDFTFTVFTPTYNRINTLHRVYDSLKRQTFRDFEWLIIDDGSSDGTGRLVCQWQKENQFPIRYIWNENKGINRSINQGVWAARGRYFLIIGSDDAFIPEALEIFHYYWEMIPENIRDAFVGVTALCKDQNNHLIGSTLPTELLDSDSLEIRYKYKMKGEMWGFLRTDVLRRFPFVLPEGTKYVPEGVVWGLIARKYKTRFINIPLRIYWRDGNENSDQLTRLKNYSYIASGMSLGHLERLNEEWDWFYLAPLEFIKSAVHFSRFSFHNHEGIFLQFSKLKNRPAKILWTITLPLGFLIYLRDRTRNKNKNR